MSMTSAGGLRYFTFHNFDIPGLVHGIFSRHGGVSSAPWETLNVGGTVGDEQARVEENLYRTLHAVGFSPESVFDVHQVHGRRVVEAFHGRGKQAPLPADAIVTRTRGVVLLMRFADCVPILLLDPVNEAIGIAHAGWQGTVKNVAGSVVNKMQELYNTDPAEVLAGIGPSICQDHYPVGPEVIEAARRCFGDTSGDHLAYRDGQTHFNLWSANRAHLESEGVRSIETAGICTACHYEDWYSHRASGGRTGRFAALIGWAL